MKAKNETLTLHYPVQLADRELTSVTMRRPTMGDILDHPISGNNDIAGEMQLIGVLCGLKRDDLRFMDAEDYWRLQEQLVRFRAAPDVQAVPGNDCGSVPPDALGTQSHAANDV